MSQHVSALGLEVGSLGGIKGLLFAVVLLIFYIILHYLLTGLSKLLVWTYMNRGLEFFLPCFSHRWCAVGSLEGCHSEASGQRVNYQQWHVMERCVWHNLQEFAGCFEAQCFKWNDDCLHFKTSGSKIMFCWSAALSKHQPKVLAPAKSAGWILYLQHVWTLSRKLPFPFGTWPLNTAALHV